MLPGYEAGFNKIILEAIESRLTCEAVFAYRLFNEVYLRIFHARLTERAGKEKKELRRKDIPFLL